MKKTVIMIMCLMLISAGSILFAQEAEDADQPEAVKNGNGEIDSSEVITILEEINQKLGKPGEQHWDPDDWKASDEGFGGAPVMAVRIPFDMATMNSYVTSHGSYDPFPSVIIPFKDSGGGTWRFSLSRYFQLGVNYWGGGFSSLGQEFHQSDADQANITIDEDGDGYDDYYSYASYGYYAWSFLAAGKIPLHKNVNVFIGGQAGIGSEGFSISRNQRTSFPLAGLGISSGDNDWERMFAVLGGWTGIQLNLDKHNVVKLGLDVGFDYHLPFYSWKPSAGTHIRDTAPPDDFNAMNLWISIGPQFHM